LGGRLIYFAGREQELEQVQTAVEQRQSVLITGLGGVGKSTLAQKVLETSVHHFTHGCEALPIYSGLSLTSLIVQIAQKLGISLSVPYVAADSTKVLDELRLYLADIDLLCLLDNADKIGLVQPLLSGLPEITWLVTSRRQLYWPAFDLLHVELLPPETPIAARMLCHYARLSVVNENLLQAQQVSARLGNLPIALHTAAGLLNTGDVPNLEALVAWLDEQGMAALQIGEWDMTTFLDGVVGTARPPEVSTLLELCGVFAKPRIGRFIYTAILHSLDLPEQLMNHLANHSLIRWSEDNAFFELHPLIHEYANLRWQRSSAKEALHRHFALCYAEYARQERENGELWQEELVNLYQAADIALQTADWTILHPLWRAITGYLWFRGEWQAYREFNEKCLLAVRQRGESYFEGRILNEIGYVYLETGERERAQDFLEQAKTIYDKLGDIEMQVRIRRHLGILYTDQEGLGQAQHFLAEAFTLLHSYMKAHGDGDNWVLPTLIFLYHAQAGWAMVKGDYDLAQGYSQQALGLCRAHYAVVNWLLPMIELCLGDIFYKQGGLATAVVHWREVIVVGQKTFTECRVVAAAQVRLAQVSAYEGRRNQALYLAYTAHEIWTQSGLYDKVGKTEQLIQTIQSPAFLQAPTLPPLELWD